MMESLLSLSFDNISSKNPKKVGKGLRQIEGLLAQICLSSSAHQSPVKRDPSAEEQSAASKPKSRKHLHDLVEDLAFREFFRLQESFEWNVASRLIETLDRLLGLGQGTDINLLIFSSLDLLQGTLLLHPPSRTLFGRERNMLLLLDLLDPASAPSILQATLHVLVVALLDHPHNTRVFEAAEGISTVTSLFRARTTGQDVRLKIIEFLYFYLMPETPQDSLPGQTPDPTNMLQRSPSKSTRSTSSGSSEGDGETKTTEEKQTLLGKHLNNVEDLVQDLREHRPFAGVVNGGGRNVPEGRAAGGGVLV